MVYLSGVISKYLKVGNYQVRLATLTGQFQQFVKVSLEYCWGILSLYVLGRGTHFKLDRNYFVLDLGSIESQKIKFQANKRLLFPSMYAP